MSIREKQSVIDGPGAHMIELILNHRSPEDYQDRAVHTDVAGMLSGLLVHIDHTQEAEAQIDADAMLTIRRIHNKHNCQQFGPETGRPDGGCGTCLSCVGYPPCRHPQHMKDVAMMRTMLRMCFEKPPDIRYLASPRGA